MHLATLFHKLIDLRRPEMNPRQQHIPVRLSGLTDGIHESTCSVDPVILALPKEFDRALQVSIRVDTSHLQVVVSVHTLTSAVFPCDRCLEDVRISIDSSLVLVYEHERPVGESIGENEIRLINPSEPVIDIAEDVRDSVLICVPMRKICGEDEHGVSLCRSSQLEKYHLEAEENTDTRWDALKSLKL